MQQRRPRPESFKKDTVRRLMARGSKTVTEVAKELGVDPSMLHRWRERFEPELIGSPPASQGGREEGTQSPNPVVRNAARGATTRGWKKHKWRRSSAEYTRNVRQVKEVARGSRTS